VPRAIHFCLVGPSEPDISTWNGLLGTTLIGIAEFHHAHGELYVDSAGRVFSLNLVSRGPHSTRPLNDGFSDGDADRCFVRTKNL
jgi:hypothetical protein